MSVVLALSLPAAACAKAPIATESTNNPEIEYEVLMERRGCEVGRFTDYQRPVYVTVCPDAGTSAAQSSWIEQCGTDGKGTPNCQRVVDRQQIQVRGSSDLLADHSP